MSFYYNRINYVTRSKKGPNDLETLKSYVSTDEIKAVPLIKDLLNTNGKMKYNSITRLKPHLTPIKQIKDMKDKHEIKLVNSVESFRNIFYEYNNKIKMRQNNELHVYRGLKNYNFSKIYEHIKQRDYKEEREMLGEVEKIYRKKNIPLPSIEKPENNLFKKNLLLAKDDEITDSIMYKLSSEKSNEKSLYFLKNIRNNINNQLLGKQSRSIHKPKLFHKISGNYNHYLNKDVLITKNQILRKNSSVPNKDYINNIQETINNIDDLDYFFESNNQQYFDYIKKANNQKKSEVSKKDNSIIKKPKIKFRKTISVYRFKTKKEDLSKENNNNKNSDISSDIFTNINSNNATMNKDINIYDLDGTVNTNQNKQFTKNYSMENIKVKNKGKKKVQIQKMYLNEKQNNSKTSKKQIKILNRQASLNILNKRLSINSKSQFAKQKTNLYEQLFSLYPSKNAKNKITIRDFMKKNAKTTKSNLEIVYDKIKNNDDFNESSDIIQKYLNVKKCNIGPKVNRLEVCHDYQNMREYLSRNDYLKKYLKLKEKCGCEDTSFDIISGEYDKYKINLDNIAEEVNKVITDV